MQNWGYLFAAYTVVWAVTFGYVLLLVQNERKLRREVETLKKSIKVKTPQ